MKIIYLFICAVLIFMIYKITLNILFKRYWFSNLKPDDKILVRIFSDSCECKREATVINAPENSYVEAKIDNMNDCANCAKIKALTKSGMDESSCWYHVTQFNKSNVSKIK